MFQATGSGREDVQPHVAEHGLQEGALAAESLLQSIELAEARHLGQAVRAAPGRGDL
jgi:hypothetical protein